MKSVSPNFLMAQANKTAIRVREVFYKRHYWSAAAGKYIWEDTWRNVEKRELQFASADILPTTFQLTDGSQEYSAGYPNETIHFLEGDEFGIDGLFIGQAYPGDHTTQPYYSINVVSKDITTTWQIQIYNDKIWARNGSSSYTSYTVNTTVFHQYRFIITPDLTLDLWVDGVFVQNMGSGWWPSSLNDSISYAIVGTASDFSFTVDDEAADPTEPFGNQFLAAAIPGAAFGIDGAFSGLDAYAGGGESVYYRIEAWDLANNKAYHVHFFSDGVGVNGDSTGALPVNSLHAIDTTVAHAYMFVVKSDYTIDLYVDGVFAVNLGAGGTGPAADHIDFGPDALADASTITRQWVGTATGATGTIETAVTRIWYTRYLVPAGSTDTVTPEARATSKIISVSPIVWQLDTDQLTEFKVSNVTITAENTGYEWEETNYSVTGHFAPNADVPRGFIPYWTKFQIRSGFQLADGTKEYVNLFTGLAIKFRRGTQPRTVQIDILGQESYMLNDSAENIATHLVDQNLGTGNGVNATFPTAQNGVGGVSDVRVDGLEKIEGYDYDVEDLNEALLPARVVFKAGREPALAEVVLVDYFYWPQNEEFNALVELLIDGWLNSDPANSIDIHPFVVANNVVNSQEFTSKAEWDTGTPTRIDTAVFPGSLVIDWEDAAFREAKTWANAVAGWTKYGAQQQYSSGGSNHDILTSDGSKLIFALPAGDGTTQAVRTMQIDRSNAGLVGSWSFKARLQGSRFSQLNVKLFGSQSGTGYDSFTIGPAPITPMFFGVAYANTDTSEHTYLITRTASGVLRLYIDGVLTATSSYSATSTSALGFEAILTRPATGTVSIEIRDINVPTATAIGIWESPVIDWTTTPFAWGPFIRSIDLDRNGNLGGSSIAFATDASADNFSTSDGYQDMASTDTKPNSTVRRYVKVKITMTVDQTQTPEPVVNAFTIEAFSTSIPVILPKLSGKTVYEAIQSLAAFANYEFGITSDQVFFFRPKATVGDPVMSLTHQNFIEAISDFDNDYERVFSKVEITYQDFVKRIEAPDDEEDSPATKFLKKTFELSANSDIQIAPTADIATAMSRDYFNRLSVLRKRFKVSTKFLPQLEISDLATWAFAYAPPEATGYVAAQNLFLLPMPAKIIGARYDTDKYECEFDVEQVV